MIRAKGTNAEKKTISFVKVDLITKLVGDRAIVENKSSSAIIENLVLGAMLPKDNAVRHIVEYSLYGEDGSVGETLFALFSNNSAGVNWKSVHDNFLPLVSFARTQELFCYSLPSGDEPELYHARQQFKSIIEKLKTSEESQCDIKRAEHFLKELEETPKQSHLSNFYEIIINNWTILKDWSITYRFLADLVRIEKKWRNYPETRVELLDIIKSVSADW